MSKKGVKVIINDATAQEETDFIERRATKKLHQLQKSWRNMKKFERHFKKLEKERDAGIDFIIAQSERAMDCAIVVRDPRKRQDFFQKIDQILVCPQFSKMMYETVGIDEVEPKSSVETQTDDNPQKV